MQRYIVDNDLKLDIKDKKHIINVMRMKINDKFQLVNNNIEYTCKITKINNKDIDYEIIDQIENKNDKSYRVIIACSLIKEQKMDYLLQKATELGVDEIIPIISERTIIKIDNKKDNKINRWKRIVKEASEQSFRTDEPLIHQIISLKELIKYEYDLKIICNTSEKSKNIKKVLQDNTKSDTIIVVIGPEGGFSSNEVEFLIQNGFISTSLGSNILRAETVPLYILSVLNYEFMR